MKIAFDIDDTIIIPSVVTGNRDVPNYDTIAIYKWFQAQGNDMILWSGSGVDWALTWGEKLGLMPFSVLPKTKEVAIQHDIDIAFDDCDVELAKVNIKVKRINNSISRADWNKNKQMEKDICYQCKEEILIDDSFGNKDGRLYCSTCFSKN